MLNIEPDAAMGTIVHVAVAVIVKDNRVLIAKRADTAHQGGLWEFPGGKVEKGESINQALSREIKEELGIDLTHTRPLIKLIHHYPDKSVLLETHRITAFKGKRYSFDAAQVQYGLEGQRVQWVKIDDLADYQFPQANKPIFKALYLPDTYLISPDPLSEAADEQDITKFLADFSVNCQTQTMIQLRLKALQQKQCNKLLKQACAIAQQQKAALLVNSSMPLTDDIKQLSSGIHLISTHLHDMDFINRYREQFAHKMIAASCHCEKDIEQANKSALDFIVISPVKETTSHPQQVPLGWGKFNRLTDMATMPVYALGGMKLNDIADARHYGAQGIAAISALWHQKAKIQDTF